MSRPLKERFKTRSLLEEGPRQGAQLAGGERDRQEVAGWSKVSVEECMGLIRQVLSTQMRAWALSLSWKVLGGPVSGAVTCWARLIKERAGCAVDSDSAATKAGAEPSEEVVLMFPLSQPMRKFL